MEEIICRMKIASNAFAACCKPARSTPLAAAVAPVEVGEETLPVSITISPIPLSWRPPASSLPIWPPDRRERRCAEPSGGDVERHVPAVIQPGRQRQPDLADDLCPELQGEGCVPPFSLGQIWTCLRAVDRRTLARKSK